MVENSTRQRNEDRNNRLISRIKQTPLSLTLAFFLLLLLLIIITHIQREGDVQAARSALEKASSDYERRLVDADMQSRFETLERLTSYMFALRMYFSLGTLSTISPLHTIYIYICTHIRTYVHVHLTVPCLLLCCTSRELCLSRFFLFLFLCIIIV